MGPASLTHHVESFRFWDVVSLWARERLPVPACWFAVQVADVAL